MLRQARRIDAFGLVNTGSICYYNSTIQALLSCEYLLDFCRETASGIASLDLGDSVMITKLSAETKKFIEEVTQIDRGIPRAMLGADMLALLRVKFPRIGNNQE